MPTPLSEGRRISVTRLPAGFGRKKAAAAMNFLAGASYYRGEV